jgi:hypothetical protein
MFVIATSYGHLFHCHCVHWLWLVLTYLDKELAQLFCCLTYHCELSAVDCVTIRPKCMSDWNVQQVHWQVLLIMCSQQLVHCCCVSQVKRSTDDLEDNTEKCTICLSEFEDNEDVRWVPAECRIVLSVCPSSPQYKYFGLFRVFLQFNPLLTDILHLRGNLLASWV